MNTIDDGSIEMTQSTPQAEAHAQWARETLGMLAVRVLEHIQARGEPCVLCSEKTQRAQVEKVPARFCPLEVPEGYEARLVFPLCRSCRDSPGAGRQLEARLNAGTVGTADDGVVCAPVLQEGGASAGPPVIPPDLVRAAHARPM